jgi:HD-like signal output (HDOD) protein/putative methionine-R-sulfoxide reductase with GAF domain
MAQEQEVDSAVKRRFFEKLESVEELPSTPQVMVMIRNISESPKSSAADLANVILKDPSLTSKILRVANSAMYTGYARKISSVTQAVVLMGFHAVRSIAFGVMVQAMLRSIKNNKHFDYQKYWLESIKIAVASRMLAVLLGREVPEEAFIAGFLCNLGELIIGQYYPEEYKKIEGRVDTWTGRVDVEKEVLGFTHQDAGRWVAEEWNFPESLVEAIARHHQPAMPTQTRKPPSMTEIVYVANWIANLPEERKERVQHVKRVVNFGDIFLRLSSVRMDILLQRYPEQVENALKGLSLEEDDEGLDFLKTLVEEAPAAEPKAPEKAMSAKLSLMQNQMAMLHQVSSALTVVESASEAYQVGMEGIYRAIGLERVMLFLANPKTRMLEGAFGFGIGDQEQIRTLKFPAKRSGGALGKAYELQRVLNVTDVRAKKFQELVSGREIGSLKSSSFVVVPIQVAGQSVGVLFADNQKSRKPLSQEEVETLDLFVNQIELALGRFQQDPESGE